MANSRRKGKTYELEVAAILRLHHLDARRGQQYSGANGDPDVVCEALGRYHLECKRRAKQISAADMYKFMEQADRDKRPGQVPVVVHRIDQEGSLVTMRIDDWIDMAKKAEGVDDE